MGIKTVEDFLSYLPRSHEDLSAMSTIASAPIDEKTTIRGTVEEIKSFRSRNGKILVSAIFTDLEGDIAEVIWFNQPHIKRMLKDGDEVVLTGKLSEKGRRLQFMSPSFELSSPKPLVHSGRLVPVYPQHDIINTKWIREKMVYFKDAIDFLPETLPSDIVKSEKLVSRSDAIRFLHFPNISEDIKKANERMAFERFFKMQCEILERKKEWQGFRQERLRTPMDIELIRSFFKSLNFTPTDSQKIAIYEILKDMEKNSPMSRLLEGDVGSGKTLVAVAVIANTIKSGGQCALMVPTEVLAKQHAQNIGKLLLGFHNFASRSSPAMKKLPNIQMLTGSLPQKDSDCIKAGLAGGTIDIVIGTHALITDNVGFKDLRLVIVDEQHRFGVEQREKLKDKGNPHFLAMTATPIPRTLALTAYGHHDLSVLLEKPGGRKPVHTKVVSPRDRDTVQRFIDKQITEGRQVFVICPLIRISENEDMAEIRSVEAEVARLMLEFPKRRIAFLHGKMAVKEKDDVMRSFKNREKDILVSTSVIEVGIDVPNAVIIVIEGAERFGLAQLHQFRGRVGRGEYKSYCFLFTTTAFQANSQRLKAMEKYDSGFMLAEIDLKLRGPGELFGLRQSGPVLSQSDFFSPEMLVRARRAAEKALGMATAAKI